jgi:hypothetical protein
MSENGMLGGVPLTEILTASRQESITIGHDGSRELLISISRLKMSCVGIEKAVMVAASGKSRRANIGPS